MYNCVKLSKELTLVVRLGNLRKCKWLDFIVDKSGLF